MTARGKQSGRDDVDVKRSVNAVRSRLQRKRDKVRSEVDRQRLLLESMGDPNPARCLSMSTDGAGGTAVKVRGWWPAGTGVDWMDKRGDDSWR